MNGTIAAVVVGRRVSSDDRLHFKLDHKYNRIVINKTAFCLFDLLLSITRYHKMYNMYKAFILFNYLYFYRFYSVASVNVFCSCFETVPRKCFLCTFSSLIGCVAAGADVVF